MAVPLREQQEYILELHTGGKYYCSYYSRQEGRWQNELCVPLDYSYQTKFFNILATSQKYFSFHPLCSI